MAFVRGVLAARRDLPAEVELLYRFCFDRVELDASTLSYEPRWSCQCRHACAAVWVASKSGAVVRIGLSTPSGRPEQTWFPGTRAARTIYHQHDGTALGGAPGESFLLIGRDDGALEFISDRHPDWAAQPSSQRSHGSPSSFHLESWQARRDVLTAVAIDKGVERDDDTRHRDVKYAIGVTAIAVIPRPGQLDTIDILVATRRPALYVITAANGKLSLQPPRSMPGWIEWILGSPFHDGCVTCISRGGDLIQFNHTELLGGGPGRVTKLPLLPTAALPVREGGVLLGTTTGLILVRENASRTTPVPLTRAAVLCLDRLELQRDGVAHECIAMGMEDGRLRVVDAAALHALADVGKRLDHDDHNITLEMGSAVMAVETLRPTGATGNDAYVFAVLRDHSMCLYHVTDYREQQRKVLAQRLELARHRLRARGGVGERVDELAGELFATAARPPSDADGDRDAWNYMFVDVVLPWLRTALILDIKQRLEILELLGRMIGADNVDVRGGGGDGLKLHSSRQVLYRLSAEMGPLCNGNAGLVMKLSRSILAAVPRGGDRRWQMFIAAHLRELNDLAGRASTGDRARLVAWTRFVRKYVLLGNTFAAKEQQLAELVEQNHAAHKYTDALIYQARLAQRGYDQRWTAGIAAAAAALHAINYDDRCIIAVVTVDCGLSFIDGSSGRGLKIRDAGLERDRVTPFAGRGRTTALASAVVRDGDLIRVVLSCTRHDGLAVLELRWLVDCGVLSLERVSSVARAQPAPVYAFEPLPEQPDRFLAGLDTRTRPFGLLWCDGETWTLDPADDTAIELERPASAHGNIPTRALAVVVDDRRSGYLAVAGSDDGLIRAVSFGRTEPANDWKLGRWDQLAGTVNTVALGRHREADPERDPDDSLFTCYVGTSAGDVFALSILARDRLGSGENSVRRFGDHDAHPLWRDSHDGPIATTRIWRTSLYEPGEVLIVATEKGRLCIYNHTAHRETRRVSATLNYRFRGMRFERVSLPSRLSALTMLDGGRELVAAGPESHVYMARLAYLRDSVDRDDNEPIRVEGNALPTTMWARLSHLLAMSSQEAPFQVAESERARLELELCDLVRLDGGALSNYALRERLRVVDRWDQLSAGELDEKARRLLRPLDPEHPEELERIKVIIKSLCRASLYRDPRTYGAQLRVAPERHAEAATTCALVADYVINDLAHSTPSAARLRIVVIKELLRVPALRHMALGDDHGTRVRMAVQTVLDRCLRDDERLVRVEALRALSVLLRNVSVMIRDADLDRDRISTALFPLGLRSLEWLLELIVGGLQRFPGLTRGTALVSDAWYHISALLQLFRTFPDRTLALCEYLIRAGLGIEVLAMCWQSLRGKQVAATRSRIANLYLIPALEPQHSRDAYIERYDRRNHGHRDLVEDMRLTPRSQHPLPREWHEIDDAAMADGLLRLLDRLAHMWSVTTPDQFGKEGAIQRRAIANRDTPFTALQSAVENLESIAADLAMPAAGVRGLELLAELSARHGLSEQARSGLTAPIRTIISGIVTQWRDVSELRPAHSGMRIGKYRLGASIADSLFELDEPPALDPQTALPKRRLIKVIRQPKSPSAASRFLEGARLTQALHEQSADRQHIVEIDELQEEPPYLAYVMPKYPGNLQDYLTWWGGRAAPIRWTERAAEHIGRALRAAHVHVDDHCHGDVKPTNILVSAPDSKPVFHLADFGVARAVGIVPRCLSNKYRREDPVSLGQWNDVAALSLILYQMLTGEPTDPRTTTSFDSHVEGLSELLRKDAIRQRVRAVRLIETLMLVFDLGKSALDIHEFLRSTRGPTRRVLLLAANPRTTRPLDLNREFNDVKHKLAESTYGDQIECDMVYAAKANDLSTWISRIQPDVVHFGGHGSRDGIMLQDAHGDPHSVSGDKLREIFIHRRVELVVLNACYTDDQAGRVLPAVSAVVGWQDVVGDEPARQFAAEFYRALGSGLSVKEALRDSRGATKLGGRPDVFRLVGDGDVMLVYRQPPDAEDDVLGPVHGHSLANVTEARDPTSGAATARVNRSSELPTTGAATQETALYLNAWFPDYTGSRPVLRVDVAATLHVNLAAIPHGATFTTAPVAPGAAAKLYEVDHVDVMVLCEGADVAPLRKRLPLPPDADNVARFKVTPRKAGRLMLSILLVVDGEAVHRSESIIGASDARQVTPWQ